MPCAYRRLSHLPIAHWRAQKGEKGECRIVLSYSLTGLALGRSEGMVSRARREIVRTALKARSLRPKGRSGDVALALELRGSTAEV